VHRRAAERHAAVGRPPRAPNGNSGYRAVAHAMAGRVPVSRSLRVRLGAVPGRAAAAVPDWRRPRVAVPPRRRTRAPADCRRRRRSGARTVSAPNAASARPHPVPNETAPLLAVRDLVKHFPVTRGILRRQVGAVRAVDGVSLDVFPGETLALVGESGCGKTTTGRAILRLIEPTSGEIRFDGADVRALDGEPLRRLRRQMQIIFQDPFSSLNPRMTVGAIVREGLTIHKLAQGQPADARVRELLDEVGLRADVA